ncbi:efflux RND transporter permease subunit [Sphingomonas hankyongi]|uniref:Efflux RND transporter permease subunit n=1 Tax=Sphingomonas hankyongi TaxID=2908209 RepID=A0ABT0RZI4_9SPHN|nr:efflux RND transporter permease subunit [Sphingomonas hankyongi]MCL6729015.1 efflux RND transporter permease subunit [Sphingomonas hankyongi]
MNFRNISSWCIRNPVFPIVLFVGLMLAGLIAFARMQVNNAPDIDFPAAIVQVSQPGAAPNEMETQVTQRVESAVRGINGVDEINSTVSEGSSQTFVTFELGTPPDRAVNDVRNAISQIRSNLPDGILEPQITRVDAEDEPIMVMSAETTDMTLEQLSWYIDNTVAKRLLGVEGIAAVSRGGGVDRTIRVILDPAALQSQGITAAQVNQQLRQSNFNGAGGRAEVAGSEQSVRVLGNAKDAYALSQTQISLPGGRFVKIADLGEVKDASSEQRTLTKMNGHQVVTFYVQRAKGSSEVTAYAAGMDALKKLETENPRVTFAEIVNRVDYTEAQYRSAMEGLVEGAVLAVLVVLLFLRDIRATAISALAIPLSAIPAFWFMSMMGITMNFMSTMAMGLVAGVLVDDAIVEIENIVRHMRMGKSGYQAALDAADEIGLAVLATTMAIVAVFLPVALMPGIAGQYFKAFGFTVVLSVLMSLLVARMITPLIAAYFLRSHGAQPHANWKWMDVYLKVLNWSLDTSKAHALLARLPKPALKFSYYALAALLVLPILAAFGAGTGAGMMGLGKIGVPGAIAFPIAFLLGVAVAYGVAKLIAWLVQAVASGSFADWHGIVVARWNARMHDHRMAMVAAGVVTLLVSVALFGTLPLSFFPPQNDDFARINVTLAPGTTMKQTEVVVDKVAAIVAKDPSVERVFERVNVGDGRVSIVLKKDRKVTSTEFQRALSPTLAQIPDARVSFQSQQGGGPDPDSRDIMLYLGGDDPVQLTSVANELVKEMATVPGLVAPRVGSNLARPEITIKPRFDLAADLGVTTAALSQTIRIATLGDIEQNSAKFSLSDRQVPITVSLSENARRDIETLKNLPVPTSDGGSVPLKAVADIGFGSGPTTINRSNQLRRLSIGADLAPGVVEGDVWAKVYQLPAYKNLPQGVQQMNLGNQKWQAELLFNFAVALISGVLLVFAVLVLLYRRFLAPFVNMGSLLLAPLGAAIALHFAGQPVSLFVLIGILMLFGIVAKNSILLVDFAVEMMNHGMPKNEAIWEAGHKRAQPIVMTTVAMVAGMLPTAISISGDNSWRAPMGITVIGGLIFSTILTLLLVPSYFSIAISIESRLGRIFHRLVGADAHRQSAPVPAE